MISNFESNTDQSGCRHCLQKYWAHTQTRETYQHTLMVSAHQHINFMWLINQISFHYPNFNQTLGRDVVLSISMSQGLLVSTIDDLIVKIEQRSKVVVNVARAVKQIVHCSIKEFAALQLFTATSLYEMLKSNLQIVYTLPPKACNQI